MSSPVSDYYRLNYFTPEQATALSLGLDPDDSNTPRQRGYAARIQFIVEAISKGKLEFFVKNEDAYRRPFVDSGHNWEMAWIDRFIADGVLRIRRESFEKWLFVELGDFFGPPEIQNPPKPLPWKKTSSTVKSHATQGSAVEPTEPEASLQALEAERDQARQALAAAEARATAAERERDELREQLEAIEREDAERPALEFLHPSARLLWLVAEVQRKFWPDWKPGDGGNGCQDAALQWLKETHGLSGAEARAVESVAAPISRDPAKKNPQG